MATVIQAQDKSGKYMKYDTKSKMKYILDYVHDPEKTRSELQGGTLLMNPENAYDEFMLTKQLWGKDQEGKRMCMHYIQSFKPGEVTPELAKQIADEFVKQKNFQGFQISYAVHTDKDHIHTHFILNTVNVEDGHKWQLADLKILRRVSDRLCKKHGLSILPEKEVAKSKSPAQRDAESVNCSLEIRELSLFCRSFFCRSSAAGLLFPDLVQDKCQAGDRCEHGAENLGNQRILRGQFAKAVELFNAHHRAFNKAALDFQILELVLLCKFAYDTRRGNGVARGAGHGSRAVEDIVERSVADLIGGEARQRVLHNGVFHTGLTELIAELRILCDSDALIVDKYSCACGLHFFSQCIDNCFFAFQYLCVGHGVTSDKNNVLMPKDMRTENLLSNRHAGIKRFSASAGGEALLTTQHLLSLATYLV